MTIQSCVSCVELLLPLSTVDVWHRLPNNTACKMQAKTLQDDEVDVLVAKDGINWISFACRGPESCNLLESLDDRYRICLKSFTLPPNMRGATVVNTGVQTNNQESELFIKTDDESLQRVADTKVKSEPPVSENPVKTRKRRKKSTRTRKDNLMSRMVSTITRSRSASTITGSCTTNISRSLSVSKQDTVTYKVESGSDFQIDKQCLNSDKEVLPVQEIKRRCGLIENDKKPQTRSRGKRCSVVDCKKDLVTKKYAKSSSCTSAKKAVNRQKMLKSQADEVVLVKQDFPDNSGLGIIHNTRYAQRRLGDSEKPGKKFVSFKKDRCTVWDGSLKNEIDATSYLEKVAEEGSATCSVHGCDEAEESEEDVEEETGSLATVDEKAKMECLVSMVKQDTPAALANLEGSNRTQTIAAAKDTLNFSTYHKTEETTDCAPPNKDQMVTSPSIGKSRAQEKTEKYPAKLHSCFLCGYKGHLLRTIEKHLLRDHKIEPGQFPDSRSKLKGRNVMQSTMSVGQVKKRRRKTKLTDPGVTPIPCPVCEKRFVCHNSMVKHVKAVHSQLTNLDQILRTIDLKKTQYLKRVSPVQVKCPICEETVHGRRVFRHMTRWHGDHIDFTAKMKECRRQFHEQYEFTFHSNTWGQNRVKCPMCQKDMRQRLLKHHIRFLCPENPDRLPMQRCVHCSYVTHVPQRYVKHLEKHKYDNVYACTVCDKRYKTRSGLVVHTRRIHKIAKRVPIRIVKCPVCNKDCESEKLLEKHMVTHGNERNFQCEICGKAFKDKQDMRKHHRTQHLKQYRYHCDKCGHGVEKRRYLDTHKCGRIRNPQSDSDLQFKIIRRRGQNVTSNSALERKGGQEPTASDGDVNASSLAVDQKSHVEPCSGDANELSVAMEHLMAVEENSRQAASGSVQTCPQTLNKLSTQPTEFVTIRQLMTSPGGIKMVANTQPCKIVSLKPIENQIASTLSFNKLANQTKNISVKEVDNQVDNVVSVNQLCNQSSSLLSVNSPIDNNLQYAQSTIVAISKPATVLSPNKPPNLVSLNTMGSRPYHKPITNRLQFEPQQILSLDKFKIETGSIMPVKLRNPPCRGLNLSLQSRSTEQVIDRGKLRSVVDNNSGLSSTLGCIQTTKLETVSRLDTLTSTGLHLLAEPKNTIDKGIHMLQAIRVVNMPSNTVGNLATDAETDRMVTMTNNPVSKIGTRVESCALATDMDESLSEVRPNFLPTNLSSNNKTTIPTTQQLGSVSENRIAFLETDKLEFMSETTTDLHAADKLDAITDNRKDLAMDRTHDLATDILGNVPDNRAATLTSPRSPYLSTADWILSLPFPSGSEH